MTSGLEPAAPAPHGEPGHELVPPAYSRRATLSRRRLLLGGGIALAGAATALALSPLGHGLYHALESGLSAHPAPTATIVRGASGASAPGWILSPRNPVLDVDHSSPWVDGAVYDCAVVRRPDGALWMWYSTRGSRPPSIAFAADPSGSGDAFAPRLSDPVLQIAPPESLPYTQITRPSVLRGHDGLWRLWYSTVGQNTAWIGLATSPDGLAWAKHGAPVLTPRDPWEQVALQCPNVLYDPAAGLYRMWYCGGQVYEPTAVGYATSPDGLAWTRASDQPVYAPTTGWEDGQIGSFQVHRVGDWHYAFYNAFQRSPFTSRVGMARSRDGVTAWQRHPANPILSPGRAGTWDAAMIYKPAALWDERRSRWDVWFNASDRLNGHERIGHMWRASLW